MRLIAAGSRNAYFGQVRPAHSVIRKAALFACCFARYAHRLRAIGHLHEATACASPACACPHADREGESQQWPDLHP